MPRRVGGVCGRAPLPTLRAAGTSAERYGGLIAQQCVRSPFSGKGLARKQARPHSSPEQSGMARRERRCSRKGRHGTWRVRATAYHELKYI